MNNDIDLNIIHTIYLSYVPVSSDNFSFTDLTFGSKYIVDKDENNVLGFVYNNFKNLLTDDFKTLFVYKNGTKEIKVVLNKSKKKEYIYILKDGHYNITSVSSPILCTMTWLDEIIQKIPPPPLHSTPETIKVIQESGGSTNIAIKLKEEFPNSSIGIVVAGNSGRPGGACGHMNSKGYGYVDSLGHHNTQEEDVVSNWLLTHKQIEGTPPNTLFKNTIGGEKRWGMVHPDWRSNEKEAFDTIQKKRYKNAQPEDYKDAWYVDNCLVSLKTKNSYNFGKNIRCSLVFVAGPQAKDGHKITTPNNFGDYSSTQFRTFNRSAAENYSVFKESVENTFYAALLSMAMKGDNIAVLCHVSGGIYAGKWRTQYGDKAPNLDEFVSVVNNVLTKYELNGMPLGCYFDRVVFSKYFPI